MLWVHTGRHYSAAQHTLVPFTMWESHVRHNFSQLHVRHVDTPLFSGLNIGAHKEAAEHFLSALSMQNSSAGAKSEQLWSTLRRTFQMMVRASTHIDLEFNN